MSKSKDEWYPKTKEEFDAYCRAMDEANELVIQSAIQRDQEQASGGAALQGVTSCPSR